MSKADHLAYQFTTCIDYRPYYPVCSLRSSSICLLNVSHTLQTLLLVMLSVYPYLLDYLRCPGRKDVHFYIATICLVGNLDENPGSVVIGKEP